MGSPCDNAFCSAFDGAVSGYGDAFMATYGAYTRGKLEALGEMGYEGLKRGGAGALGGYLGTVVYDGYQASELVRSAPGIAAAVAADPKALLCEGDGCGIDDYGRLEANVAGGAAGPAGAVAVARMLRALPRFRVAFGLNLHPFHGRNNVGLLERFAKKVGAKTYWEIWGDDHVDYKVLGERLLYTMDHAGSIHFNLDGLVRGRYTVRSVAEVGKLGIGRLNVTNWELHMVVERYLGKTTFYLNGKRVSQKSLGL